MGLERGYFKPCGEGLAGWPQWVCRSLARGSQRGNCRVIRWPPARLLFSSPPPAPTASKLRCQRTFFCQLLEGSELPCHSVGFLARTAALNAANGSNSIKAKMPASACLSIRGNKNAAVDCDQGGGIYSDCF